MLEANEAAKAASEAASEVHSCAVAVIDRAGAANTSEPRGLGYLERLDRGLGRLFISLTPAVQAARSCQSDMKDELAIRLDRLAGPHSVVSRA